MIDPRPRGRKNQGLGGHKILWPYRPCIVFAAAFLFVVAALQAAENLENPKPAMQITLEWLKPAFSNPNDAGFLTSTFFLSGIYTISDRAHLRAEIPMAVARFDEKSETALGNSYFALNYRQNQKIAWEAGIWAPLLDTDRFDAFLVGLITDFINRGEAFAGDAIPIQAGMRYQSRLGKKFSLEAAAFFSGLLPKNDNRDETEIYFFGGETFWVELFPDFKIGGGFRGRYLLNPSDQHEGDSRWTQIMLNAKYTKGRIHPGFTFRIPLAGDLAADVTDFTFGFSLAYQK